MRALFSVLFLPALAAASNLYVSHYNGNVYSLALTSIPGPQDRNDGSAAVKYTLSQTAALKTCGSMPSWLTFDASTRVLYCSDESGSRTSPGSLTALAAAADGRLSEIAKVDTIGGGVNNVIYNRDDGKKFIAIAHYEGSALSTFPLPLRSNTQALQTFNFTLSKPGAVPSRQDAPHPHEVFLDPTGTFLLSPDLGSDLVRVYRIDPSSGSLKTCPALKVTPGTGPRHGVFWTPGASSPRLLRQKRSLAETVLYVVGELGNKVTAYSVSYDMQSDCLGFNETQALYPYPNGTALPSSATVAEIRLEQPYLYISIRSDHAFPPNDSLATLSLNTTGAVSFQRLSSSFGTVPRTFAINKQGDLVAIGNQASSNVAIVQRDPHTGQLGDEVANLAVGEPGTVGAAEGLSSVIWE
ncbi:hypothetical protein DTO166G4_5646 [Paecilomyces variotii]|uniref:6-phosphogluconolactonase n=1 Tax=Byssochlamys spectabilis TaxID=264951 RepID=A0A443HSL5_BYSSP|nr:6-phosphogluconolactonase [Paecilomyces variotii]KAJ9199627.1 hypothetical protein DTO164E3_4512 [Paecilomyces variotii]KAJ9203345.1 hypothetical protein DTO032I3_3212 [Paecilomyces variotii]KAJ9212834.1 hypothetical protein DTO166G4_5646 [Paecilomyces variotii]KAJ9223130.1 hypothetical protein DTO169C6_4604 [Paecilomyces variotii]KAJ9232686.1 hypothetical protein DTO166G5_6079 [Paecilomyces variotii]